MVSELINGSLHFKSDQSNYHLIQGQQNNQMCCDLVIWTLNRFSNHLHCNGPRLGTEPEELDRFLYYSACLHTLK